MAENNPSYKVQTMEYLQGQYVIREGEPGDCAYVLLSGEVEVVKSNHEKKEVIIAVLGKNEIFGEMSLFEEDCVRSASVRIISERAQVMSIDKTNFQNQLSALPEGVRNIIVILIERLRRADNRIVILC